MMWCHTTINPRHASLLDFSICGIPLEFERPRAWHQKPAGFCVQICLHYICHPSPEDYALKIYQGKPPRRGINTHNSQLTNFTSNFNCRLKHSQYQIHINFLSGLFRNQSIIVKISRSFFIKLSLAINSGLVLAIAIPGTYSNPHNHGGLLTVTSPQRGFQRRSFDKGLIETL